MMTYCATNSKDGLEERKGSGAGWKNTEVYHIVGVFQGNRNRRKPRVVYADYLCVAVVRNLSVIAITVRYRKAMH